MRDKLKSMWTGTVGLGLVVVPIKLGTAVSEDKLPLHQVRRKDGSRIKLKRVAEADGQEVEWSDLTMGYETPSGQTVLVEKGDFERAYGEKNRAAKIVAFVSLNEIPRAAHEVSYCVQPAPGGEKAYELLAEALKRTGKAAIVNIAIRDREALAVLYTTGDGYLVVERLQWAAAVKKPDFSAPKTGIAEDEVKQAVSLIELTDQPFDWQAHTDESMAKLEGVIQGKVETGQVLGTPKAPGQAAPLDLAEALKASVAQAKAAKAPVPAARKPRTRKTAAAKTETEKAA